MERRPKWNRAETTENKTESEAGIEAEKAKQAALAHDSQKPGAYTSKWQQQLDAAMEKILNREKFSYDLNGDALYRQYKDQAVKNGRLAMMDSMGRAASMTGGYGSTYSQSAGQQAYQKQMDALADKAGELYNQARQDYDRQGQQEQAQYDLLRQQEEDSYGRYRQDVSSWEAEKQRLWQRYDNLRKEAYDVQRDAVKDEQWRKEFEEAIRQFEIGLLLEYGTEQEGGTEWFYPGFNFR